MRHRQISLGVVGLSLLLLALGCASAPRSEVVVLGMIHGGHRTSEVYGIGELQEIVRRIDPDFILCEIPPGRLSIALEQYRATGEITEPRVRVFPEYVDAIIPLERSMGFELIPCAGWTQEMADDRRAKLALWRTERSADHQEMSEAQANAEAKIAEEGRADDPAWIHTDRYDDLVRAGMEPYNRLFNDDLGLGGWDNINAAHYANIERALEAHRGEGKRFLITFGSWHKYWILDRLGEQEDVRILDVSQFLGAETHP